ncbi:MAG: hypothetical protein LKF71_05140 [Oscillospiraceae bacterium]|nr:hypothetical protein [Oscillospiraceae bacterium]
MLIVNSDRLCADRAIDSCGGRQNSRCTKKKAVSSVKSDVMTRIFISAAVDKGFKDIERDPKRSVRQLVDLGTFFAKGRFQRYFFDIFGEMLRNERSSYYKWIHDLVVNADQKQLKAFGMNLAYNSWTVGAKTVRALEQDAGHNVPWTLVFQMAEGGTLTVRMLDEVIRQGREMGIYCYMFFCGQNYSPLTLEPLLKKYSDCAFILLVEDAQITQEMADAMLGVQNTLTCIRWDNPADFMEKAALMSACKCFFAAWCPYNADFSGEIYRRQILPNVLQANAPFFFFVADSGCPEEVQKQMREYTIHTRQSQRDPVFCIDFYSDLAFIDDVISSDSCVLEFNKNGETISVPGCSVIQPFGLCGSGMTLQKLLQQFLPHSPAAQMG